MIDRQSYNYLREWLMPKLKERGMSVEELAQAIGLSRSGLYCYLSDRKRPSREAMALICDYLNVPLIDGLKQYTFRKTGRPLKRASTTSPAMTPVAPVATINEVEIQAAA